jgi:predicted nucleic acid-binding protein
MILLDTNVVSEFMRPVPAATVLTWLDAQVADGVFVSAITRAEIELGLGLMPDGRRKSDLMAAAKTMFVEDFPGRCLPFDETAASCYATISVKRIRLGRPISVEDAQIAAIALANGLTLATRNDRDFQSIDGLTVVNPWQSGPPGDQNG